MSAGLGRVASLSGDLQRCCWSAAGADLHQLATHNSWPWVNPTAGGPERGPRQGLTSEGHPTPVLVNMHEYACVPNVNTLYRTCLPLPGGAQRPDHKSLEVELAHPPRRATACSHTRPVKTSRPNKRTNS